MVQRDANGDAVFTSEMRKTHTILVPMMLPIHFSMVVEIMKSSGYHIAVSYTHLDVYKRQIKFQTELLFQTVTCLNIILCSLRIRCV